MDDWENITWAEYLQRNPAIDAIALDRLGGPVAFYGVPRPDVRAQRWCGFHEFFNIRGFNISGLSELGGWQFTIKTQRDADCVV